MLIVSLSLLSTSLSNRKFNWNQLLTNYLNRAICTFITGNVFIFISLFCVVHNVLEFQEVLFLFESLIVIFLTELFIIWGPGSVSTFFFFFYFFFTSIYKLINFNMKFVIFIGDFFLLFECLFTWEKRNEWWLCFYGTFYDVKMND